MRHKCPSSEHIQRKSRIIGNSSNILYTNVRNAIFKNKLKIDKLHSTSMYIKPVYFRLQVSVMLQTYMIIKYRYVIIIFSRDECTINAVAKLLST